MDVRREWIDSTSNYYSKTETISDVKENYDIRRYYSAEGSVAIIDDITTQVIVQSHANPLNEGKYDKKIHMPIDTIVNTGSIVEWENNKWIIVSNIDNLQAYKTASMIKCNNTFPFYDSTSTLHTIPCIVTKGLISLDEQKIISTLDSEIAVQISDTSITRQIEINNVFRIGLRNYSVTDINDITIPGLLLLKMVYSEVSQQIPTFTLEILNGSSIQVNENDPLTINVQVKIDGVIASPMPSLVFSSSDITKATINSSTGVVTILNVGSVNFSCKMANNLTVMDTISVEIVEVPIDNFTLEVSGSTSIIKTYSSNYTCVFRNNGLVVSDTSVFYLTGDDGISATSLASIVSQDGAANSCIVKGLGLGYVRIFANSLGGEIVSSGFRIQVKSLF